MKIINEFMGFLREFKILAIAVAFIVGAAANDLIKSFVNNILMPTITPFISGGEWQTAKLALGPIVLTLGAFVGSLVNFLILAVAVFLVIKPFMKKEAEEDKKEHKKSKKKKK